MLCKTTSAMANVKNPQGNGNFIKASRSKGVSAELRPAASQTSTTTTASPSPMRLGKDAYPISSFTWMLVPLKSADPAKGKVIKDLLSWIVNYGENEVSALSYAPLPKNVAEKELKTIYSLQ